MDRRHFLCGSLGLAAGAIAGCLGETDHLEEFEENLESRGLEVNGVELSDQVVLAELETDNPPDDIAAAGLAFVDQIDEGWEISRLDGLIRSEIDLGWYVETEWAVQFIEGDLSAAEFGERLDETTEPVIVLEEE